MIPNFVIFGKTISAYMITALTGVLVLLFSIKHIAKKNGMDPLEVQNTLLISFIGVVFGGHIFSGIGKVYLMIQEHVEIVSLKDFISKMITAFSGSVFYGGLIGALIVSFIYIKKKKYNLGEYADISAMSIPLFHFFGRIGCFLSGCCYGIESECGFVYHYSIVESANGVRRFPIQLVEAAFNLCLFLVLCYFYKNKKFKTKLLYIYLMSYAIARFIFEYFRGDEYRGFIGIFSVSQFVSIVIVIVVPSFILIKRYIEKKKQTNS